MVMEILYVIGGFVVGLMFYINKKLTEANIVYNIEILFIKDLLFNEVYKYVEKKESGATITKAKKDDLFSYFKAKSWNPIRSLLGFKNGFLPKGIRELVKYQEGYLRENEHFTFAVSSNPEFQKNIKELHKEADLNVKRYLKSLEEQE